MKQQLPGIRIVTINTGKCDGPYPERLGWLVAELRRLHPDVVALQEAFESKKHDLSTVRALSEGLDMDLFWTPARLKCRQLADGRIILGWSGMALLARGYWLETQEIGLPADARDGERIAQVALASIDGFRLFVANVHLTHVAGADRLRRAQLLHVLAHPMLAQRRTLPRIVCGDFNTMAPGPVLSPFLEGAEGVSIKDAFELGGGRGPRATLPGRPGNRPVRPCVDYIFSVAGGAQDHPLFASSEVVLNRPQPETGYLPSDHFGVATTLVLRDNSRW